MKVGIATDHNGSEQKKDLIDYLKELNYEVVDLSINNTPTDDFPEFAKVVCEGIQKKEIEVGILMCGTGIGMSITANKFKGIRCAKVSSPEEAVLAKEHNDANIIALSYTMPLDMLKEIIKKYLETPFSFDERHIRRIAKITAYEEENV